MDGGTSERRHVRRWSWWSLEGVRRSGGTGAAETPPPILLIYRARARVLIADERKKRKVCFTLFVAFGFKPAVSRRVMSSDVLAVCRSVLPSLSATVGSALPSSNAI